MTISNEPTTAKTQPGSFTGSNNGDTVVNAGDLVKALQTTNVIVQTGIGARDGKDNGNGNSLGDITVAAQVLWSTATTLTLSAFHNIVVNSINTSDVGTNPTIKNTGGGSLILRADSAGLGTSRDGTNAGTVILNPGSSDKRIDWSESKGNVSIYYNPTGGFGTPTDFTVGNGRVVLDSPNQLTAYMVGAAGNAGPKSPPLYPGADPHVISVTATDVKDRGFRGANQGPQLSVAAPGVEVLAPAPEENYQMSTGTSIATAHVSGVVALMLERNPRLTPAEVRRILEETATDLGPKGKDAQFGWGLVNPQKALQAAEARIKSSDAAKP